MSSKKTYAPFNPGDKVFWNKKNILTIKQGEQGEVLNITPSNNYEDYPSGFALCIRKSGTGGWFGWSDAGNFEAVKELGGGKK